MKRKFVKKVGAVTMATMMSVAPITAPVSDALAASSGTDYKGHWAESDIDTWLNAGLLTGFEDGTVRPDSVVTRAQFVTMINRVLGLTKTANINFSDVPSGSWFNEAVSIAVAAGYANGMSDTTFEPETTVTREQAATFVARAIGETGGGNVSGYTDASTISSWATDAVGAMSDAGYLQGMSDGRFAPKDGLTRAQAVTLLERVRLDHGVSLMPTLDTAELVIEKTGEVIEDVTIDGDVIVASTVREGDVFFKNVHITGDLLIQGGGSNSIYLEDVTIDGTMIMDKNDVRVELVGNTVINAISILKGCHVDTKNFTGSVKTISIDQEIATGKKVTIDVDCDELIVNAPVKDGLIINGNVGSLTFTEESAGSKVTINGTVDTVVSDGKVTIDGSGTVNRHENNASTTVGGNVDVEKEVLPDSSTGSGSSTPSGSGGSSTGDSSSNSGVYWPTVGGGSSSDDDDDDSSTGGGNTTVSPTVLGNITVQAVNDEGITYSYSESNIASMIVDYSDPSLPKTGTYLQEDGSYTYEPTFSDVEVEDNTTEDDTTEDGTTEDGTTEEVTSKVTTEQVENDPIAFGEYELMVTFDVTNTLDDTAVTMADFTDALYNAKSGTGITMSYVNGTTDLSYAIETGIFVQDLTAGGRNYVDYSDDINQNLVDGKGTIILDTVYAVGDDVVEKLQIDVDMPNKDWTVEVSVEYIQRIFTEDSTESNKNVEKTVVIANAAENSSKKATLSVKSNLINTYAKLQDQINAMIKTEPLTIAERTAYNSSSINKIEEKAYIIYIPGSLYGDVQEIEYDSPYDLIILPGADPRLNSDDSVGELDADGKIYIENLMINSLFKDSINTSKTSGSIGIGVDPALVEYTTENGEIDHGYSKANTITATMDKYVDGETVNSESVTYDVSQTADKFNIDKVEYTGGKTTFATAKDINILEIKGAKEVVTHNGAVISTTIVNENAGAGSGNTSSYGSNATTGSAGDESVFITGGNSVWLRSTDRATIDGFDNSRLKASATPSYSKVMLNDDKVLISAGVGTVVVDKENTIIDVRTDDYSAISDDFYGINIFASVEDQDGLYNYINKVETQSTFSAIGSGRIKEVVVTDVDEIKYTETAPLTIQIESFGNMIIGNWDFIGDDKDEVVEGVMIDEENILIGILGGQGINSDLIKIIGGGPLEANQVYKPGFEADYLNPTEFIANPSVTYNGNTYEVGDIYEVTIEWSSSAHNVPVTINNPNDENFEAGVYVHLCSKGTFAPLTEDNIIALLDSRNELAIREEYIENGLAYDDKAELIANLKIAKELDNSLYKSKEIAPVTATIVLSSVPLTDENMNYLNTLSSAVVSQPVEIEFTIKNAEVEDLTDALIKAENILGVGYTYENIGEAATAVKNSGLDEDVEFMVSSSSANGIEEVNVTPIDVPAGGLSPTQALGKDGYNDGEPESGNIFYTITDYKTSTSEYTLNRKVYFSDQTGATDYKEVQTEILNRELSSLSTIFGEYASQDEIDFETNRLLDAMESAKNTIDITKLYNEIEYHSNLKASAGSSNGWKYEDEAGEEYFVASYNNYDNAVNKIYEEHKIFKQEDVDKAAAALAEARGTYLYNQRIGEELAIFDVYNYTVLADDYTADSYAKFKTAFDEAKLMPQTEATDATDKHEAYHAAFDLLIDKVQVNANLAEVDYRATWADGTINDQTTLDKLAAEHLNNLFIYKGTTYGTTANKGNSEIKDAKVDTSKGVSVYTTEAVTVGNDYISVSTKTSPGPDTIIAVTGSDQTTSYGYKYLVKNSDEKRLLNIAIGDIIVGEVEESTIGVSAGDVYLSYEKITFNEDADLASYASVTVVVNEGGIGDATYKDNGIALEKIVTIDMDKLAESNSDETGDTAYEDLSGATAYIYTEISAGEITIEPVGNVGSDIMKYAPIEIGRKNIVIETPVTIATKSGWENIVAYTGTSISGVSGIIDSSIAYGEPEANAPNQFVQYEGGSLYELRELYNEFTHPEGTVVNFPTFSYNDTTVDTLSTPTVRPDYFTSEATSSSIYDIATTSEVWAVQAVGETTVEAMPEAGDYGIGTLEELVTENSIPTGSSNVMNTTVFTNDGTPVSTTSTKVETPATQMNTSIQVGNYGEATQVTTNGGSAVVETGAIITISEDLLPAGFEFA